MTSEKSEEQKSVSVRERFENEELRTSMEVTGKQDSFTSTFTQRSIEDQVTMGKIMWGNIIYKFIISVFLWNFYSSKCS